METISVFAWRRYFAKFLDIFLSYIIFALIIWIFLLINHAFFDLIYIYFKEKILDFLSFEGTFSIFILFLLLFFIPIVYDIICFYFLGNTLWKMIYWIKVKNKDWENLEFREFVLRIFYNFLYWLWGRIFLVWIFTMFLQFLNIKDSKKNFKWKFEV